jgi:ABC-type dipeptide/oligopeptide/nickel transport system ATPase component
MADINSFLKNSGIVRDLAEPDSKLITVIGGSDSGKTTLVEMIAHFFYPNRLESVSWILIWGNPILVLLQRSHGERYREELRNGRISLVRIFILPVLLLLIDSLLPAVVGQS